MNDMVERGWGRRSRNCARTTVSRVVALAVSVAAIGCSPVVRVRPFQNDKIAYWTAEGGVVISSRSGEGRDATTRICVAPPAQGARQKDLTGAVGGKVPKTQIELDASGAIDHETTALYDQSDAGLFFQFALYRLCEAHLNGAVTDQQYVRVYGCLVQEAAKLVEVEHRYADAANARAKYANVIVAEASDGTGEGPKTKEGGEREGGGSANQAAQSCWRWAFEAPAS